MTVIQLIEKLKELDPNAFVHVGVYTPSEYGFEYYFGALDKIDIENGLIYLDSSKQY